MDAVCISGMGMITPLGNTVSESWDSLCRGTSGITDITLFDTSTLRNPQGGQIHSVSENGSAPRSLQFLLRAAKEAIESSGLTDLSDCGLVIGTNFGAVSCFSEYIRAKGEGNNDRESLSKYRFQYFADELKRTFSLNGPSAVISIACATGVGIIDTGLMMLRHVPRVLCVSADELTLYSYAGLNALRAISKDKIRPFSKNRSGTLFGEGAGAVILESRETIKKRNGRAFAKVQSAALNNDAFHTTAPDKEGTGIAAVMNAAFSACSLKPEDISYLSAHGTGTKYNDSIETSAVKKVYGEHASSLKINSLKSMTAHGMGAAGIIELICSVQSLITGRIPPTINFEEKDEECGLDYCLNAPAEADILNAMSNSYGIGGANGSAILSRAEDE